MRTPIVLLTGVSLAALALAQGGAGGLLSSFSKAMNDAKTVTSTYTFQTLTKGGPVDYAIALKKPNLFRVETPAQTVVADGKQITVYDKKGNTYFKQPETAAGVKALFAPDELHVFAGFFDSGAYSAVRSKDLGNRSVKGGTLSVVQASYDSEERKVVTYLLDPGDKIARKAQIELDKNDPGRRVSMMLDTKTLAVNANVPDSTFAFEPPADSRELSMEEINSDRWYYDLEEAKKVAKASNKMIFVDFFATWCGPCKMLENDCFGTDQFKAYGKKLVFCRIDVDAQKDVAQAYGITAMPTQDVMDKDGNVVKQIVGYGGPDMFFSFLSGAVGGL